MAGDLYYRVGVSALGVPYDLSADICSATISQQEGMPDQLTVELNDPYKVLGHALREGMDIEVELGTDDDHAVVFRGQIYRVEGSFPDSGIPTLSLQAYDALMEMGLRPRNRPFTDVSLQQIVATVAKDYFSNLDLAVQSDPRFPGNGIRQQEETDLAFLMRLAQNSGHVMYVTPDPSGDTFHFISQLTTMKRPAAVKVYYGRTGVEHELRSFQASADISLIQLPRAYSGFIAETGAATSQETGDLLDAGNTDDRFFDENLTDFRSKQPTQAEALERLLAMSDATEQALRTKLGESVRAAIPTFTSEAQQRDFVNSQFSTSLRGMRASATADGIRQLTAQTSVEILDVGGRFSGTWFLSQVRHILDEQGYRTEFECRR